MVNQIIDFHSHVLPGIDDGSRNIDESVKLLDMELEQGVTTVVATPHFYAQEVSVNHFLYRRKKAFEETIEHYRPEEKGLKLICGAEVYYFPGIGTASQLGELTMEGSRVLLLEMPFAQWTESIYEDVRQIIRTQELTVVLAHIERFFQFQKDIRYMEQMLELPVWLQVNGGCFMDWGRRRLFKKILKTGKPLLLGSDCHNIHSR